VREGEQPRDSSRLAQLIGSYAAEWSPLKQAKDVGDQVKARKFWSPPPENAVKINCDGAFSVNTRSGGWGFLIREWDGGVISSGYGKLENVSEAFHAEIVACLQALQRAADLGVQRVILETDATMIVQAVKSADFDRCSAGGLMISSGSSRTCLEVLSFHIM
jgi:hypothetical protein